MHFFVVESKDYLLTVLHMEMGKNIKKNLSGHSCLNISVWLIALARVSLFLSKWNLFTWLSVLWLLNTIIKCSTEKKCCVPISTLEIFTVWHFSSARPKFLCQFFFLSLISFQSLFFFNFYFSSDSPFEFFVEL